MYAEAAHQFSSQANDWGFTTFASHQEIYSRGAGFVVNDTLRMNVVVRVDRPEDMYYDSKKSTGYVGLKNQGATCYMNSLLQTLYNINYFRQVQGPLCCSIHTVLHCCTSWCAYLFPMQAVLHSVFHHQGHQWCKHPCCMEAKASSLKSIISIRLLILCHIWSRLCTICPHKRKRCRQAAFHWPCRAPFTRYCGLHFAVCICLTALLIAQQADIVSHTAFPLHIACYALFALSSARSLLALSTCNCGECCCSCNLEMPV